MTRETQLSTRSMHAFISLLLTTEVIQLFQVLAAFLDFLAMLDCNLDCELNKPFLNCYSSGLFYHSKRNGARTEMKPRYIYICMCSHDEGLWASKNNNVSCHLSLSHFVCESLYSLISQCIQQPNVYSSTTNHSILQIRKLRFKEAKHMEPLPLTYTCRGL